MKRGYRYLGEDVEEEGEHGEEDPDPMPAKPEHPLPKQFKSELPHLSLRYSGMV